MPNHEPPNGPPEQPEAAPQAEAPRPDAPPPGDAPRGAASEPTPPRDLAQRVWGSWPTLPAGAAPAPAQSAPPAAAPGPSAPTSADVDIDDEPLEVDLLRLEDRLQDTEGRVASLAESTEQALRSLGETVRASTAELPGVIEAVLERRLNAVGDALLKLADLRARLQEDTGEAVKSLHASFEALEERLAETTQRQVQASLERLAAEVRAVRDDVTRTAAGGDGPAVDAAERRLRERVRELPTRGDLASIRGAIASFASSVQAELAEAAQRIARIEEKLASPSAAAERPAVEAAPAEREGQRGERPAEPFDDGPLFDFPER